MRKVENHQLPNLPLVRKILATSLLLFGWVAFATTWWVLVTIVDWSVDEMISPETWGADLQNLAWTQTPVYLVLFSVHAVSIVALYLVASYLFKKSSVRRRVKGLVQFLMRTFLALDLLTWVLPFIGIGAGLAFSVAVITGALLTIAVIVSLKQIWVYRRWRSSGPKRVVIVGGGFAGLYAALGLDKLLGYHKDLEVLVFDRKNYFLFPPLLPSTAAGTIETRQVTYPFRRIFETTNIVFRKATVSAIDTKSNTIKALVDLGDEEGEGRFFREVAYEYDYLMLAPGSENQTFNTPGAKEYAFFMKELGDAIKLRNHIIDCFERAAICEKSDIRRELLNFVIVGGGPTGVETATEIHDLIENVLLKRYPEIESREISITLVQSGDQILPGWNGSVVSMTSNQLSKLKIELALNNRVTEIASHFVKLKDGKEVHTRTCVWCAGVKPSALLSRTDLQLEKSGRAIVGPTLQAQGAANVFVLGDSAYLVDEKTGRPLPPLGQVAFQQGSFTAANLIRMLQGKAPKSFKYFNFGALVSVGEHYASVDLLGFRLSGFIGWVVWRSLYLAKLVGVSNKLRVMIDWSLDLLIERSISQIRDDQSFDTQSQQLIMNA